MSAPRKPRSRPSRRPSAALDPRLQPLADLDEAALDGLTAPALAQGKKALARVKTAAAEGLGALALHDALGALLGAHDGQHAAGIRTIVAALRLASLGLPPEHSIQPTVAWSLILQASAEWHAGDPNGAWQLYEEAAAALALHPSERARDLHAYAAQQLVRMRSGRDLGEPDFEASRALLEALMTSAEGRFAAYVRNRALEAAAVWVCNREESRALRKDNAAILELSERALALPRGQPNGHTWTFVLHLLGRRALAYREEGRLADAQASCAEVLSLLPQATLPRAREHAAWALAEGAFVAADLRERPDEALPFLLALRRLFAPPRNHVEASELAYGIAMEVRCAILGERPEEAARALDDLERLAAEYPRSAGVRTAVVASRVLRGDLLALRGARAEAIAVWRAVAEEFEDDPDLARQAESRKAVERMRRG